MPTRDENVNNEAAVQAFQERLAARPDPPPPPPDPSQQQEAPGPPPQQAGRGPQAVRIVPMPAAALRPGMKAMLICPLDPGGTVFGLYPVRFAVDRLRHKDGKLILWPCEKYPQIEN